MDFTLHLFLRIFLWALFILILWGLVGSQKILYPPKQDLDLGPKDEGIDYEAFHTLTGDGIKIHGWYYPGRDAKGVVIVCHGYGASKSDLMAVTRFIWDHGYALVLFDFRGHGESEGRRCSFGKTEIQDLKAVIQWVKGEISDQPIGVYGFSMGGAIAIRGGGMFQEIQCVVSDNTFIYLDRTIRRHHKAMYPFLPTFPFADSAIRLTELRIGSHLRHLSPLAAVDTLGAKPLYLIHSEGDPFIHVEEVQDLFSRVTGPKKIWIAKTRDHLGASAYQEDYETSILEFLDRCFRSPSGI